MGTPGSSTTRDQAAAWLREGRCVLMPTETLYGVFASSDAALDALHERRGTRPTPGPRTWHAPDPSSVREAVTLRSPLHRRALARLAPGAVRFLIEREGGEPQAVRVPDHAGTREVLRGAGVRLYAERAGAFGLGDGRTPPTGDEPGLAGVIDDGPTRLGQPSTTLRLRLDGSVEVEHVGAVPARAVERALRRTILFVCSGNTCRSPMAAALARDLLARRAGTGSVPTVVRSAGTGALGGEAMTREAEEVLRERGVDPGRHRAEALDRRMLEESDVVYAMTRGHLGAIRSLDAGVRAEVLDPSGRDVPDPIGGPRSVYRETAARLAEAIARRLDDLDLE